jgi:acyl carrier protein
MDTKLKEILESYFKCTVLPSTSFVELEADELDFLELFMIIENSFDISIPESISFSTASQLQEYISTHVR